MVQKYIEKTKTEAGTRVLPMSDDVYEAFKRVISGREKPKVEEMIDGYTGFLFLDNRGKPMMPYQWEKKFQHSVAKYNKISFTASKDNTSCLPPHLLHQHG